MQIDPATANIIMTSDEEYSYQLIANKVLKALVLALNDGSFVPGSNLTIQQLKTIIKAKMQ